MTRSMAIGMTDYSSQSPKDMLIDLEQWIKSLQDTNLVFNSTIDELRQVGYWENIDFDFRASCFGLVQFFTTAVTDLQEVINGMHSEIKPYHIRLLKNLGNKAQEQHTFHRKKWREYENKEYGDPTFRKVEKLYEEGSDMTGDMYDLNNLMHRLEDFVGMSKQETDTKSSLHVSNHFNAPITGMQQNYESKDIHQFLNIQDNTKKDINELREIISQLKEILEQSTSGEKEEIAENINDLEEAIEQEVPKKSRIKAFGTSVGSGMKKLLTMKAFNNMDEMTVKLPRMIDNFNSIIDRV